LAQVIGPLTSRSFYYSLLVIAMITRRTCAVSVAVLSVLLVVCVVCFAPVITATNAEKTKDGYYIPRRLEEEEEKPTNTAVAVAATLIGAISFQMALMYLLNHDDQDMKKYSYEIINATVSIFTAVLLFQSANDLVGPALLGFDTEKPAVNFGHMLFWYAMLQFSLAYISGAIELPDFCASCFSAKKTEQEEEAEENMTRTLTQQQKKAKDAEDEEKDDEEKMDKMELNMKSYATLLAHLTGFASINAWGSLQQFGGICMGASSLIESNVTDSLMGEGDECSDHGGYLLLNIRASAALCFAVIPISFLGQFALQRITNYIRYRVAMGDDGEEDEFEKLWDEEAEESENDVMGLTLSFNLMQAIRAAIVIVDGKVNLPNPEGEVGLDVNVNPNWLTQGMQLYGVALLALLVMAILFMRMSPEEEEEEEEGEHDWNCFEGVQERTDEALILTSGMLFAWSVFFCSRMMLLNSGGKTLQDPMLNAVCLTMVVSFVSFSCIRGLDCISDRLQPAELKEEGAKGAKDEEEQTGTASCNLRAFKREISNEEKNAEDKKEADVQFQLQKVAAVIKQIIKAIGILVGFGWEQCFDQAVKSIASACPGHGGDQVKVILGLFCVVIIVPAWKWYILPMAIKEGWKFGYVVHANVLEEQQKHLLEIQDNKEEKKRAKISKSMKNLKPDEQLTPVDSKKVVVKCAEKDCPNTLLPDSAFCRMCGTQRNEHMDPAFIGKHKQSPLHQKYHKLQEQHKHLNVVHENLKQDHDKLKMTGVSKTRDLPAFSTADTIDKSYKPQGMSLRENVDKLEQLTQALLGKQ